MTFNTNSCTSRYSSVARLANRRHSLSARLPELVYRTARPLARPTPPPAPRIIQNTVHQTVVHLHQTTHQHILNRLSAARDPRGNTALMVRQTAVGPASGGPMDESRPALAARRMLRVLSTESARQTLRPFYREMLQGLLEEKREEYRGRPAHSLLLVQAVLGRRRTLDTLRRFYRRIVNHLDESSLQNMIFRRSVRHIWRDETGGLVHQYAHRELDVPEELCRLKEAKPVPSPMQPPEPEDRREPEKRRPEPPPVEHGLRLTDCDFRVLVRGVADALGRQSRLESLRRGGM